jgi:hypothetical protein
VQALQPGDAEVTVQFCRWLLNKCADDPLLLSRVLFTDEACFAPNGALIMQNTHTWAAQNSHDVWGRWHQQQFSTNIWAGIVGDHLIGPHMLPARMNDNQ